MKWSQTNDYRESGLCYLDTRYDTKAEYNPWVSCYVIRHDVGRFQALIYGGDFIVETDYFEYFTSGVKARKWVEKFLKHNEQYFGAEE